ncbi:MAG: amidohydrolase family protein [Phycisphaerales bacterium]
MSGTLLILGLAATAAAQDLGKRPGPQAMPVAITNATIHPVSGPAIDKGFVLFDKGRITEVGPMGDGRVFIATTRVVDAKGLHVYPGLIAAVSQIGLREIESVRASNDMNEVGEATPEAYAASAINPDSALFPVTRANGVLAAGVFPTGGLIPGRASVIRFEGWTPEEMTVKQDAGLVIAWPQMRTVTAWWMDKSEDDQRKDIAKNIARLRDIVGTAQAYLAQKDGPDGKGVPLDLRWEAMRSSFAAGSKAPATPVFVEAQEYDQITSAVAFCIERGVRPVIVGGRDAPLCAELLKKHDVPVIVLGAHQMPRRDDSAFDEPFTLPARLAAAGVRFCMASGEETPHERNLPYNAGRAVGYGLDHDAALKAITLWPAQILGVGDVLGSLDVGKEATLIVTDGDPLEVSTQTRMAFIQGKAIDLSSKHSALAEKYREKYVQQPAGAPRPAPVRTP